MGLVWALRKCGQRVQMPFLLVVDDIAQFRVWRAVATTKQKKMLSLHLAQPDVVQ